MAVQEGVKKFFSQVVELMKETEMAAEFDENRPAKEAVALFIWDHFLPFVIKGIKRSTFCEGQLKSYVLLLDCYISSIKQVFAALAKFIPPQRLVVAGSFLELSLLQNKTDPQ